MKQFLQIMFLMPLVASCGKQKANSVSLADLNGNWYLDYGWGPIDTAINYTEFYIKDSILSAQNETAGQSRPQRIVVKGDSIYFSRPYSFNDLFAYYNILYLRHDTLWLRFNPYLNTKWDTVYWVRLPKQEKGFHDHYWRDDSEDSLFNQLYKDYHRRMWRHHYYRWQDLKTYDSLLESGIWN